MTLDLATSYLGLRLRNPFVVGASPLGDDLDTARRLEDSGAAALVMHSLFEEQLTGEQLATFATMESAEGAFAEAVTLFPRPPAFSLGPEEYLEHLRRLKSALAVPVVASLHGSTAGGWLTYARLMQDAGADALELNVYYVATDPGASGELLERRTLAMVETVKHGLTIPVAVKISPYYTSLSHFALRLEQAGADGLVLFNRFYQPDLDPENLEVERRLRLSTPAELPLRLRWLAILSGRLRLSLAATGGVHGALDAVKAVAAGADAVQLVSALLQRGPDHLRAVREGFGQWLDEHGYGSLAELRGSLNLDRCPDPAAYERANYMQLLQSWPAAAAGR
jgi:dihydroorotate dehydrogenase (fumarate)